MKATEARKMYDDSWKNMLDVALDSISDAANHGMDYVTLDYLIWEEEVSPIRDKVVAELKELGYTVSEGADCWVVRW